jgi:nucleotide-binding universal stress UspA family protein
MFDKILVAIDNTASSQAIFEQALALAVSNQSQLMLLHVLEPMDSTYRLNPHAAGQMESEFRVYMKQLKELEQVGLDRLRALEEKATAQHVSTEFTQSVGDAGRIICAVAKSWDADLIMIGRRGHRGISEFFLGSVSNYVLHHAHCNVLTLQHAVPVSPDREVRVAAACST